MTIINHLEIVSNDPLLFSCGRTGATIMLLYYYITCSECSDVWIEHKRLWSVRKNKWFDLCEPRDGVKTKNEKRKWTPTAAAAAETADNIPLMARSSSYARISLTWTIRSRLTYYYNKYKKLLLLKVFTKCCVWRGAYVFTSIYNQ